MRGERAEPRPPRLAKLLVSAGASRDDRALVLADLDERFRGIARERGEGAARRWYWWQALRAIPCRIGNGRDVVGRLAWTGIAGDVRQRTRALLRRRAFTLGVLGTMAVGLASATVVGALAWNVWLAPMPFPDADRVVRLFELEPPDQEARPGTAPTRWRLSPPLLEDLRRHDWTTVAAVAGVSRNVHDWDRDGEVSRVTALVVSPDLFEVLGTAPREGRLFRDDPDAGEVLLSEDFWTRVFGRDPSVVGSGSMTLDGRRYAVVGVVALPRAYPGASDVVVPMSWAPEQLVTGMRGARYLDVVARVRPEFDVAAASAEMARLVSTAGREYPNHRGWSGEASVLGDELLQPYRGVLALLLGAGCAFLLLAVVNVAGLVAARTIEGRPERGVRLALGASEWTLLRGSLIESGLLALGATVAAFVLARWLLVPIHALVPSDVPRIDAVGLGWGSAAAVACVGLAAATIVGALAHVLGRGGSPADGRRLTSGRSASAGRSAIVVSQVGLTTLLVMAGAVVLRTVLDLRSVDLGFDPEGVASSQVSLSADRYPSPETRLALWRALLAQTEGRGLVAAVGTSPPMAEVNMPWGYRVEPTDEQSFAQYHIVSPVYFSVMGIDVLEGRPFDDGDDEDAPPVIVINDALAEAAFPGGSALGRRLRVVSTEKTVVGVVAGTRHFGPDQEVPPEIYAPFTQDPWPHAQILVEGTAAGAAPAMAAAAEAVDPHLGMSPLEPYRRFISEWYAELTLQLVIVGVLAAVGLLLATFGLYALIAYGVNVRRREIGVRMALGASGRAVFARVLRQGMAVAATGMAVGLALWYLAVPVVRRRLVELGASDPWIPVGVVLLIGATSALATAIPARRSMAVEPAATLRGE